MARPYARVPRAQYLPGRCLRCPRNTNLIDLGNDNPQQAGAQYLCEVCLGELTDALGLVAGERYAADTAAYERMITQLVTDTQTAQLERDAALLVAAYTPTDEAAKDLTDGISALVDRFRDRVRADSGRDDLAGAAAGEDVAADEPAGPGVPDDADAADDLDTVDGDVGAAGELRTSIGGLDILALLGGEGADGDREASGDPAVD